MRTRTVIVVGERIRAPQWRHKLWLGGWRQYFDVMTKPCTMMQPTEVTRLRVATCLPAELNVDIWMYLLAPHPVRQWWTREEAMQAAKLWREAIEKINEPVLAICATWRVHAVLFNTGTGTVGQVIRHSDLLWSCRTPNVMWRRSPTAESKCRSSLAGICQLMTS